MVQEWGPAGTARGAGPIALPRVNILEEKPLTWSPATWKYKAVCLEWRASPHKIPVRRAPWQEFVKTSFLLLVLDMTVFVFSPERLPGHGSSVNITELLASSLSQLFSSVLRLSWAWLLLISKYRNKRMRAAGWAASGEQWRHDTHWLELSWSGTVRNIQHSPLSSSKRAR